MSDTPNAGIQGAPAAPANTVAPISASSQGGQTQNSPQVPLGALQEEREKRQALQGELDVLRKQVESLSVGQVAPQPVQYNDPTPRNDQYEQLENLWREDPKQAMRAELMMAINWRDTVDQGVDEQMDQAASKFKDFNDYQSDVRKYIRRLPVEQRTKNGLAEAAYFMLKGRKSGEIASSAANDAVNRIKQGEQYQTIVSGTSSGGGQPQGGLSSDERAAAAALGIPEAEYMKYKKR